MPSRRSSRETAITAVSLQFSPPVRVADRAPGEAHHNDPVINPHTRRHDGLIPVTPRNGLPELVRYRYRGTGHDMTGNCMCGTPCPWSGRRTRTGRIPAEEWKIRDEQSRRQAERRAALTAGR